MRAVTHAHRWQLCEMPFLGKLSHSQTDNRHTQNIIIRFSERFIPQYWCIFVIVLKTWNIYTRLNQTKRHYFGVFLFLCGVFCPFFGFISKIDLILVISPVNSDEIRQLFSLFVPPIHAHQNHSQAIDFFSG